MKNLIFKSVEKSTLKNIYALFFDGTGFLVKKSGVKNNSLKPLMVCVDGNLLPEYSDEQGENLKIAIEKVIDVIYSKTTKLPLEKISDLIAEGKDILMLSSASEKLERLKKQKEALTELEKIVLKKCINEASNGSDAKYSIGYGFSFRVCEGNLSYAGAFSTLQRKGYITTHVEKIGKRKEKIFGLLLDMDGNPVKA